MADTVEFELVSPQKLLKSEPVEVRSKFRFAAWMTFIQTSWWTIWMCLANCLDCASRKIL